MEWKELQYALGGACIGVAQDNALGFYGTIAKVSHMESYLIVAMGVWSNLGRAPPIWLLTHLTLGTPQAVLVGLKLVSLTNQHWPWFLKHHIV